MELHGDILIGAPREQVWLGLNDAEVLVRCIPGCESLEVLSATERSARVMVKVGPVRARFNGHVRMDDIRPSEGCTLHFEGSGGPAGMAKGQSAISLTDEADGTRLQYTVQASVGGKLGQVGGRMIDAAAKQMADQFFAAFNAAMAASAADADANADAATEAVPAEVPPPTPPDAQATAAAPAATAAPAVTGAPTAATATATPAAATAAAPRLLRPPAPPPPAPLGEGVRVLWFALGALSTGFGVWIASLLGR